MSNIMTYKGYSARVEYDDDNGILFGQTPVSVTASASMPTALRSCAPPSTKL